MFTNIGGGVTQLCKFGLPTLDEIVGGGLPRGTTWLIEDEIGADAEPFIMSFLASGLQAMDYIFLLSTEQTFDHYRKTFQTFGRNPDMELQTGRLRFIDGFSGSYQLGLSTGVANPATTSFIGGGGMMDMDHNDGIETLRDLTQPREINEAIRRSLLHVQEGPATGVRGACISLSTIIYSAGDFRDVYTFIQNRRAMDKLKNSTTLLSIHADAHDEKILRSIEHAANGVLKVQRVESGGTSALEIEVVAFNEKPESIGRKAAFFYVGGRLSPVEF